MEYIPVEGHSGLVRDKKSGAIINIDNNEMMTAKQRKIAREKNKEDFEQLKQQVQLMNNDLSEIKQLLNRLVQQ